MRNFSRFPDYGLRKIYLQCGCRGGATGETGGKQSPTPPKGHFCKSSKTDEKILGYGGVTSPTILEFQPEFVTSGFQRLDLTYIYPIMLTNFILLKLFFCHLK